jgi:hypothetical protein
MSNVQGGRTKTKTTKDESQVAAHSRGEMQYIEDLSNDEKSYFRLGLTRTDDIVQTFLRHSPCLKLLLLCIKGKPKN